MKKTIITIIATICVVGGICAGVIINLNDNYNKNLETVRDEYELQVKQLNDEVEELNDKVEESGEHIDQLEEQVYNIVKHKAYEVTIERDGKHVTFGSDGRLFGETYEYTTY